MEVFSVLSNAMVLSKKKNIINIVSPDLEQKSAASEEGDAVATHRTPWRWRCC